MPARPRLAAAALGWEWKQETGARQLPGCQHPHPHQRESPDTRTADNAWKPERRDRSSSRIRENLGRREQRELGRCSPPPSPGLRLPEGREYLGTTVSLLHQRRASANRYAQPESQLRVTPSTSRRTRPLSSPSGEVRLLTHAPSSFLPLHLGSRESPSWKAPPALVPTVLLV